MNVVVDNITKREGNGGYVASLCSCCSLVSKPCLSLCDPINCSTPGFSVLHCLPEFAQIHVH